jgi:hypothetical protein
VVMVVQIVVVVVVATVCGGDVCGDGDTDSGGRGCGYSLWW